MTLRAAGNPKLVYREKFLRIRLFEAEYEQLEAKARRADLSLSDYVRRETGLRVNRRPPARPRKLLRELEQIEANPGEAAMKRMGIK